MIDSGLYTLISVTHGEGVVHYKAFVPEFSPDGKKISRMCFLFFVSFFAGLCIFREGASLPF
jgi:hypothetical protein